MSNKVVSEIVQEMKDSRMKTLKESMTGFHSYSVKYKGPAKDFNGEAAHTFTVTLGSSDKGREIEDLLVAILERELA